jgi:hypothetical protein
VLIYQNNSSNNKAAFRGHTCYIPADYTTLRRVRSVLSVEISGQSRLPLHKEAPHLLSSHRSPLSTMMADPLPPRHEPPFQLPTPGPSPSTHSQCQQTTVGPISSATGLPDALSHIPIEYIIDRLRSMAPYYWHRPDTTNCTIS